MQTDEAKQKLDEILDDNPQLDELYQQARQAGLPVDFGDGFERHGYKEDATAIVLDCEDGDVTAEWSFGRWLVQVR